MITTACRPPAQYTEYHWEYDGIAHSAKVLWTEITTPDDYYITLAMWNEDTPQGPEHDKVVHYNRKKFEAFLNCIHPHRITREKLLFG